MIRRASVASGKDKSHLTYFFSPPANSPTSHAQSDSSPAGGAFRHCLHHTIFLPAAWSVVPNKISFNPPRIPSSTATSSLSREDYFAARYWPESLFANLIGGFPVHVILVLAIHRGVLIRPLRSSSVTGPIREQGAIPSPVLPLKDFLSHRETRSTLAGPQFLDCLFGIKRWIGPHVCAAAFTAF